MARLIVCVLFAISCLSVVHAAPQPTLTATWQGQAAIVAWSGAPAGSCVYADYGDRSTRLEPCGSAQTVTLPSGGVDGAYVPHATMPGRPGTVYRLHDERGQRDLATATLPGWTAWMPIAASH